MTACFEHTLTMTNAAGAIVGTRKFRFRFDRDSGGSSNSTYEEYNTSIKARELFRDAAYAAGKWPIPHTQKETNG